MKKLLILLSGLLIFPAFAEVAPQWYYEDEFVEDVVAEPTAAELSNAGVVSAPVNSAPNLIATPSVASGRIAAPTRSVSRAAIAPATATQTVSARAATVSRSANSRAGIAARATGMNDSAVVARRASDNAGPNTARAATEIPVSPTPLYNASATEQARIGVRSPSTGMMARGGSVARATSSGPAERYDEPDKSAALEKLAQMTDFCKASYMNCMDNFCNVLDDNQGRCSCSVNIKNYAKSEDSLKSATEALQKVALDIQYLGLTAEEVKTMYVGTEAENAMRGLTDTTDNKREMDDVLKLLVKIKTPTSSSGLSLSSTSDFTDMVSSMFSDSGFDFGTLFGIGGGKAASISNQRGKDLYDTATARCKTAVITDCAAQGVDTNVIQNSYDLEIDKQCIQYQRSLEDSLTSMNRMVINGQNFLKQARLKVAAEKNSYEDTISCVNALDSCMQNDFVCGDEYEACLDPSGKYIVDGKVIIGSLPGQSGDITGNLYKTIWKGAAANNAWADAGSLSEFITANQGETSSNAVASIIGYIENKIGKNKDGVNDGMCVSSTLNKCQRITYTKTGKDPVYNPKNEVVKTFFNRTLRTIKANQDDILAKYAEGCRDEVYSCLSNNGAAGGTASAKTMAKRACLSYAKTCASVTGAIASTATDSQAATGANTMMDDILAQFENVEPCATADGSGSKNASGTCVLSSCNSGKYLNETTCTACPAGYYCVGGATSPMPITACAAGKTTATGQNANDATPCTVSCTANATADVCPSCPLGVSSTAGTCKTS
jgi:hypothetical protein